MAIRKRRTGKTTICKTFT